jgi:hypothetical protein
MLYNAMFLDNVITLGDDGPFDVAGRSVIVHEKVQ